MPLGVMNLETQFLQRTCPHGLASIALGSIAQDLLAGGTDSLTFFCGSIFIFREGNRDQSVKGIIVGFVFC